MTTVLDPVDVTNDADDGDPFVHLTEPPYTHGICGAPLRRPGEVLPDDGPIDCVVCADLDRHPT